MSRLRALVLLVALILAGCGSTASATPTPAPPTPTPLLDPYSSTDVPVNGAPDALKKVWRPYQVLIIPSRHIPSSAPPPPTVVNATAGLVPNSDAQHWAIAFFRAQAWRKWAAAHAQSAFLKHLDSHAQGSSEFDNGASETLPDCALFPTAMTLVVDPIRGDHQDATQFAFLNTYTGPCAAVYNEPDRTQKPDFTIPASAQFEHYGSMHGDPLLGDVWIEDAQSSSCENLGCFVLPTPLPAIQSSPGLPPAATPYAAASPALQLFWKPYEVSVIPAKTVLTDIPKLPPLDNRTDGIVDAPTAELWERALMRAAAYATFSWSNLQMDFREHVAAANFYQASASLSKAANDGGKPVMMPCALFPISLTLQPVTADEQSGGASYSDRLQYEFVAKYQRPCTLTITYANGTTGSADLPDTLTLVGAYREDPVLGNLFFVDSTRKPDS
ncbi:MAG: hypothetical protein ACR2GX_04990 [Candidatus Dormibacteria bacterium]